MTTTTRRHGGESGGQKRVYAREKRERGTAEREAAAPKNHPRQSANRLLQYRTPAATRNTRACVRTEITDERKIDREREKKRGSEVESSGRSQNTFNHDFIREDAERNHRARKRVSSPCVRSVRESSGSLVERTTHSQRGNFTALTCIEFFNKQWN